jgi:hypothetical protein
MKIKIIVVNSTGSEKRPGELCLNSGIIKYDSNNEYAHISSVPSKSVYEVVEAIAPVIEKVEIAAPPRSHAKKQKK